MKHEKIDKAPRSWPKLRAIDKHGECAWLVKQRPVAATPQVPSPRVFTKQELEVLTPVCREGQILVGNKAVKPKEAQAGLPPHIQRRFDSFIAFANHWRLAWNHHRLAAWRMVEDEDMLAGEVTGIPASRGILKATNGVECLIDQGERLFIGHIDWWVADEQPASVGKPRKRNKILNELLA